MGKRRRKIEGGLDELGVEWNFILFLKRSGKFLERFVDLIKKINGVFFFRNII